MLRPLVLALSDLLRRRRELVGIIALVIVQMADQRGRSAEVVISERHLMLLVGLQVIHQELLTLCAGLR